MAGTGWYQAVRNPTMQIRRRMPVLLTTPSSVITPLPALASLKVESRRTGFPLRIWISFVGDWYYDCFRFSTGAFRAFQDQCLATINEKFRTSNFEFRTVNRELAPALE